LNRIAEPIGARSIPVWQERVEEARLSARRRLGEDGGDAAFARGLAMDYEQALQLAREVCGGTVPTP